jgi:3-deoxy-7-phosphoheptulonate synthase
MLEWANCKCIWQILTPIELKERLPLSAEWQRVVNDSIIAMQKIFEWKSNKIGWIVGPCSIDFEDSVLEFAEAVSKLRKKYGDTIEIIMRFYTRKPRTIWGWKGIRNSKPWEEPDIRQWLINSRSLAIQIIEKYWVPLANEMLYPEDIKFDDGTYSYMAIWARSATNQEHREVASGLEMPVGFKNPESWDLSLLANSVKSWQTGSDYILWNNMYKSTGNKLSHWILRGSTFEWERSSNFDKESLKKLYEYMTKANIENPSFMVDTNHDNSWKDPSKQLWIMKETLSNLDDLESSCPGIKEMFKWFMTESYIHGWKQDDDLDCIQEWKSLTDPCSSIGDTIEMAEFLSSINKKESNT